VCALPRSVRNAMQQYGSKSNMYCNRTIHTRHITLKLSATRGYFWSVYIALSQPLSCHPPAFFWLKFTGKSSSACRLSLRYFWVSPAQYWESRMLLHAFFMAFLDVERVEALASVVHVTCTCTSVTCKKSMMPDYYGRATSYPYLYKCDILYISKYRYRPPYMFKAVQATTV
jgi:hypothetical protein